MNAPLPAYPTERTVCSTERMLCHCLKVTESSVRDAIQYSGCETLGEIQAETGAGTGCTACHRRILAMLSQHRRTEPVACE